MRYPVALGRRFQWFRLCWSPKLLILSGWRRAWRFPPSSPGRARPQSACFGSRMSEVKTLRRVAVAFVRQDSRDHRDGDLVRLAAGLFSI
jgi:hypothetical protein